MNKTKVLLPDLVWYFTWNPIRKRCDSICTNCRDKQRSKSLDGAIWTVHHKNRQCDLCGITSAGRIDYGF